MMLSPGYGCRAGGRHSASTPLGTQWTGTLGYFAESTAASWGVLAMTPSAARTVSRSSRGTRTPNSRVWTTGWDSQAFEWGPAHGSRRDRKSTRLNSSHGYISYAVFCLKKKKKKETKISP